MVGCTVYLRSREKLTNSQRYPIPRPRKYLSQGPDDPVPLRLTMFVDKTVYHFRN
jgi:hypothetical protein